MMRCPALLLVTRSKYTITILYLEENTHEHKPQKDRDIVLGNLETSNIKGPCMSKRDLFLRTIGFGAAGANEILIFRSKVQ
jgi:hypothetical protein